MADNSAFDLKGFLNDPKVQADKTGAVQFLQSKGIVDAQGNLLKSAPVAPTASQDTSNATFPSAGNESVGGGILKTLGNIPSSTLGFVKNAISTFNPINTVKTISQIPSEFSHLVEESGGVKNAIGAAQKEVGPSIYGALVPKATQQVIKGDFQGARVTLQNDPVGQILPFLLLGKTAAEEAGVGGQFDTAVRKLASPVTDLTTNVASKVIDVTKDIAPKAAKFFTSQATGLSPETITKVISDPESFTKEAQATLDRGALANDIKTNLDTRQATLKETGSGYSPIRESQTPIGVSPDWLTKTIEQTTGLKLIDGQWKADAASSIRDTKDVRAIQSLYDTHQPVFDRGAATTNEFLNLRTDLGSLAKVDRELSRSGPLEKLSGVVRGKLNSEYRGKIPNLGPLDQQFSSQIEELNRLQKGILDKDGNLTDTGINRIANAAGKGKDLLLTRLEEISPGITGKIKTLKAIEDIKNSGGPKVGTYARAGGLVTGLVTLNPYLIAGSILAMPDIAVPLLRGIGMAEPKVSSTLKLLGVPFKAANNFPEIVQSKLQPR